jgi:hypothetical protein
MSSVPLPLYKSLILGSKNSSILQGSASAQYDDGKIMFAFVALVAVPALVFI